MQLGSTGHGHVNCLTIVYGALPNAPQWLHRRDNHPKRARPQDLKEGARPEVAHHLGGTVC